jgi:adherence and virulence protein A
MILRKYLEGAIIQDFTQVGADRIIHLDVDTRDELGDEAKWRLTLEMMGKHSNVFLVDRRSQQIIDCLKRIPLSQNTYRTLQPGATYQLPPHQTKLNPFEMTLFELDARLNREVSEDSLTKSLMSLVQGISTLTANEIVERSMMFDETIAESLWKFLEQNNEKPTPTLAKLSNGKSYFTVCPYYSFQNAENQSFETLSELLTAYYVHKVQEEKIQQLAGNLLQMLKSELKKNREKLVKFEEDLQKSEKAEQYRIKGELLNTCLYQIEKGQTEIQVENYYDNNELLTIPLSTWLTPSQNAQAYFKKYQKLRNSIEHIEKQQAFTHQEIQYLEQVLYQIEEADVQNLEIIREELVANGYLKRSALKKGKQKVKPSKPYVFYSNDGTRILVGRNNLQNDHLTLKQAKKEYLWLHAQNIPGSHVIVESASPSDETIGQAAMLAAYYSKYRHSATVPVDYVSVSKIRKPNGSKPGFVVYEGQQNTYITPDEAVIQQIRENKPKE